MWTSAISVRSTSALLLFAVPLTVVLDLRARHRWIQELRFEEAGSLQERTRLSAERALLESIFRKFPRQSAAYTGVANQLVGFRNRSLFTLNRSDNQYYFDFDEI